jgi:hypothetical protein
MSLTPFSLLLPIVLVIGFAAAGCRAKECSYEAIARSATSAHYPDYPVNRPLKFIDRGDHRTMYFALPPGWAGGSPEVIVDKMTCKINDIYRTQ